MENLDQDIGETIEASAELPPARPIEEVFADSERVEAAKLKTNTVSGLKV